MNQHNRFGILLALFIFFILLMFFNGYSTDDAYISFRYAQNLASGKGLVFNADQVPVEGYTNFLWTVILAGFAVVRLPLPETAAFLSSFFSVALLILIGIWANRQKEFTPQYNPAIPMLLMASMPGLALWSTTGMETPFFAFLLILGSILLSIEERHEWIGIMSGLVFAFSALTRPEGILLGGIIIVVSYIESREWAMRFVSFIIRLVIFLLPPLLHMFWRKTYYGQWLPNTFYAKTGSGHELAGQGLTYLKGFMIQGGGILILFLVLALFIRPRIEGIWTILCMSVIYSSYVVWVGGDWMPANRLFLPIIPFLVIGASAFINKSTDVSPRFSSLLTILTCVYFLYAGIHANAPFMQHSLLSQKINRDGPPVDVLKELGLHLRETASPYDVVAVVPAGKVPFYSGLRTIDMRGLCDAHIAQQPIPEDIQHRLPGHLRRDPAYVLSKKPDYIVLSGATPKDAVKPMDFSVRGKAPVLDEWSILKMPEFIANYREVRVPLPHGEKDLLYYKRAEAPAAEPKLKFPNGVAAEEVQDRLFSDSE